MSLRNVSNAWKIGREKMKTSNKNRLKKLEERHGDIDNPTDCVIIFDPELPLPDLSQFGDRVVILLPDNQRPLS